MKKIILSFALMSVSACAMMAQTNNNSESQNQRASQEQSDKKINIKQHSEHRGMMGWDNLFEGLDLTEVQQDKLAALRDTRFGKDIKKGKDGEKKDVEKNENLTVEQKRQMRIERAMQQKDERKNMLMQVKEILTPDQYVTFLENFFLQQGDNLKGNAMRTVGDKKFDRKPVHKMQDRRDMKERKEKKSDKSNKD